MSENGASRLKKWEMINSNQNLISSLSVSASSQQNAWKLHFFMRNCNGEREKSVKVGRGSDFRWEASQEAKCERNTELELLANNILSLGVAIL
jgi:hypothetical protein